MRYLTCIFLFPLLLSAQLQGILNLNNSIRTEIKLNLDNTTTFDLNIVGGGEDILVDWGDGSAIENFGNGDRIIHNYSPAFDDSITITKADGLNTINTFRVYAGNFNDNPIFSSNLIFLYNNSTANFNFDIGLYNPLIVNFDVAGKITGDVGNADFTNLTILAIRNRDGVNPLFGDSLRIKCCAITNIVLDDNVTVDMNLNRILPKLPNATGIFLDTPTGSGSINNFTHNTVAAQIRLPNAGTMTGSIDSVQSVVTVFTATSADNQFTGDVVNLIGIANLNLQGNSNDFTYSSTSTSFNASISTWRLKSGQLSDVETDNLLIDWDDNVGDFVNASPIIEISGTNAARTTASDAAVSSLVTKGVTVITN